MGPHIYKGGVSAMNVKGPAHARGVSTMNVRALSHIGGVSAMNVGGLSCALRTLPPHLAPYKGACRVVAGWFVSFDHITCGVM